MKEIANNQHLLLHRATEMYNNKHVLSDPKKYILPRACLACPHKQPMPPAITDLFFAGTYTGYPLDAVVMPHPVVRISHEQSQQWMDSKDHHTW